VPLVRVAVGGFLVLASLAVAGYGLLYIGAIWTSDSSTLSLVSVGGFLLVIAVALMALAVLVLRGGRRGSADNANPS
jgi:hypothetical protein